MGHTLFWFIRGIPVNCSKWQCKMAVPRPYSRRAVSAQVASLHQEALAAMAAGERQPQHLKLHRQRRQQRR